MRKATFSPHCVALLSMCMVIGVSLNALATITNDVLFTDTSNSILWKTVCSENIELPISWPSGAASAVLTVSGPGFATLTQSLTPPTDTCALSLNLPTSDGDETLLTFSLRFFSASEQELDGESLSATLGFVRGIGNGTSVQCHPSGTASSRWPRIESCRAVLPILEDVESMSLDGISVLDLDAPGWYLWNQISVGNHVVSAVTNGLPFLGTFTRINYGGLIIIR